MTPRRKTGLTAKDLQRMVDESGSGFHFPSASEVEARKHEIEVELTTLRNRLAREIHAVVPKCHNCGGTNILIKTSSHLVDPGNDIVGPSGRGPSYSTDLDGLYCEDCGAFYFNSKIADLEQFLLAIEQAEVRLRDASSERSFCG